MTRPGYDPCVSCANFADGMCAVVLLPVEEPERHGCKHHITRICGVCNGSGEGMYEGMKCPTCGGGGEA